MAWLQLHITTHGAYLAGVEAALEEQGAESLTVSALNDDSATAIYGEPGSPEQPCWEQVIVSALFAESAAPEALLSRLTEVCGTKIISSRAELLGEQDWSRSWMDRFVPLRFGARLWVVPSWLPSPDPLAVNVVLEPGMAFGTGTHPTTAMCLEWLAEHPEVADATVMDYGCGSGILAIAAAKLGARTVQAVDLDKQALLVTMENAVRNDVTATIGVYEPATVPLDPVDIVLANILLEPLCDLAPELASRVRRRGQLVLSGLLMEQLDACVRAYAPWFDFSRECSSDGWGLLAGTRRE